MHVDDLILVSIDDHVVEPPDMFERHVPAKWADTAPKIVHGRRRQRDVALRGRRDRLAWVSTPSSSWPKEEWGFDPIVVRRDAPGRLRHPRARPRHEPQRHPRVHVLPDLRRLQRRHLPASARTRTSPSRSLPGLQRLAHRRVVRRVPGPLHPAGDPAGVGPRADGRRGAPGGGEGLPRGHHARAAPHAQGLPSYHNLDYWDPFFAVRVTEEHVVMCLHIGQGFSAIKIAPDGAHRQPASSSPRRSRAIAAQDLLWGRRDPQVPRSARSRWSEGGIGWIPFYLDRCDRHYTNQRWLGHDFGDKLPSDIFRRSLARLLHDRPGRARRCATTSGSTSSPGSATTRTRTRSGPTRRRSCWPSSTPPARPTRTSTRSLWQNTCRFFGYDAFEHIARKDATVGALRAQSPDVDTATRSRAEWRGGTRRRTPPAEPRHVSHPL